MPADVDDGIGEPQDSEMDYNAASWNPADMEYGVLCLLMVRAVMPDPPARCAEVEHIKFVDSKDIASEPPPPPRKKAAPVPAASDNEDDDSEGEPYEATEPVSWSGKPGSWWRVNGQLGEDLLVREGVSLHSSELRRIPPGELVQQGGPARTFCSSRGRGCIRLPVRPSGWVTADASKIGGPKYLVRAGIPRWRVVYYSNNSKEGGSVIVREEPALQSEEVTVLHNGDIVEQAGPTLTRPDGILRMPVTSTIVRRSEQTDNGDSVPPDSTNGKPSAKTYGWVTIDASPAGGPVFFKPAVDSDQNKRRRRPKVA